MFMLLGLRPGGCGRLLAEPEDLVVRGQLERVAPVVLAGRQLKSKLLIEV